MICNNINLNMYVGVFLISTFPYNIVVIIIYYLTVLNINISFIYTDERFFGFDYQYSRLWLILKSKPIEDC